MDDKITVRLLTAQDSAMFCEVRLRACREEPASFLDSYEELESLPQQHFKNYFNHSWIVGAFMDEKLVGITGIHRNEGVKTKHKGTVWGVYVAPEARGLSCGKRMIEMAMHEAKNAGVEVVMLSTDVSNPITVNLYESLGFASYGVEKHILKLADGSYVDDVWMIKFL